MRHFPGRYANAYCQPILYNSRTNRCSRIWGRRFQGSIGGFYRSQNKYEAMSVFFARTPEKLNIVFCIDLYNILCYTLPVNEFCAISLWLCHESRLLLAFLFYGVLPHTAGMTSVCCQANTLDFTRIVVSAFFAPKCRKALRIYHQERWNQKMKFRRKWKPGGHPRC